MKRRLHVVAVIVATLGTVLAPAVPAMGAPPGGYSKPFPSVLTLPDGFRPEGIAIGAGPFAYFGSLADGSIYRVNLANGHGQTISPPTGTQAVGMTIDNRGRLFVAGGATGDARVVDARSGEVLQRYQFTTAPGAFVNDVVVTPAAAYFTDSFQAVLYKVPLGRHGALAPADGFETIPLTGDLVVDPAAFNSNGIVRTPDGRSLIIVQSYTGLLFRVDPRTGVTTTVDLGGTTLVNGDGLLLSGRTLYVVRNRENVVTVVRLDATGSTGTVVGEITDPNFDVPTTVALYGDRLYLPNARFGIPAPETATYNVVAVRRF